jgi:hypothetical protein
MGKKIIFSVGLGMLIGFSPLRNSNFARIIITITGG